MSSYVSEFLINPVLRQARRLSEISRSTFGGDDEAPPAESSPRSGDTADSVDSADNPSQAAAHSRSLSASTQETIVEEPDLEAEAESSQANTIDHLGIPISPRRRKGPIPEDDGMGAMRARIQAVNARDIPSTDKARLLHNIILEGYRSAVPASSRVASSEDDAPIARTWEHSESTGPLDAFRFWQSHTQFTLSESDVAPTYAPARHPRTESPTPTNSSLSLSDHQPPLGCEHYERNVKLECSTCKKWYTCRFCHDLKESHSLIRKETKHMLCMLCATPQKASDVCVKCGETAAQYYCNICKLWENRPNKPIYHCNDCGICRRGLGLGKDFFHCKTCRACITTSIESSHKCIERSTDCDCPICGDYMFTSPKPVVFMTCGHSIHKRCYDQHLKLSYRCPICNKSLTNMETHFRNLDLSIQNQPMPPEFRDTRAKILCNDCSGRSIVSYHWLGLKCSICQSYNTVELQIIGGSTPTPQDTVLERAQASRAGRAYAEQRSREGSSAARPTPISGVEHRSSMSFAARRRHSSNVVEPLSRVLDRFVRSASPPSAMMEYQQNLLGVGDEDSDDDILGFWRQRNPEENQGAADDDDDEDGDYEEEEDEEDEEEDDDDDEDDNDEDEEDDENDFMLFGHR